MRWTAIVTLGRSFSVKVAIHAKQTVQNGAVQDGAASFLQRVVAGVPGGGAVDAKLAVSGDLRGSAYAGAALQMDVEEWALREAFGTECEEYSQETKRLIPGVYCVCWCGALTRGGRVP